MNSNNNLDHVSVSLGEDYSDIRESVRRICAGFPGEYWRHLEEKLEYPTEFVKALTDAGYLGALIPEEYGGAGLPLRAASVILEEIHASGCNAGACHAQMYIMGTLLRHGSEEQKKRYLPKIASGELRLQAFGVTEPTSGTDTTQLKTRAVRNGDHYVVHGQKVWTSRALHSDLMLLLARTTPLDQVKKKTEGLSVFLVDIRESLGKGLEIKPLKAMINHHATEVFFDGVKVPAENLIGEEGKGFSYILDGLNAERILIAAECIALGITPRDVSPAGVSFNATAEQLFTVNLWSRLASRVLVRLAEFEARDFATLEKMASRVPWHLVLSPGAAVRLRVTCRKSRLYHSDAVAERVARGITNSIKGSQALGRAKDDEEDDDGNTQLIVVRFDHDRCTISADSSAEK